MGKIAVLPGKENYVLRKGKAPQENREQRKGRCSQEKGRMVRVPSLGPDLLFWKVPTVRV